MPNQKIAEELKELGSSPSLMTHMVYGYPTCDESEQILKDLDAAGSLLIEVQIPFSDPMADGPTIMAANEEALRQGVTPKLVIERLSELSEKISAPLIIMTYFNIILSYGTKKFCEDASKAGVSGLIVPDLPFEEAHEGLFEEASANNLEIIPIVSPVSSEERLKTIAEHADCSLVYCLSRTGTTGAKDSLEAELKPYLERVRKVFNKPLAVGFGISSSEQVRGLTGLAEIAVVGSATIDHYNKNREVRDFIASLLK